ncbi:MULTISPECIES: N-acetyltransferase [Paenibacillus]|uniref:GCN5-related N-acetyltransferase n=2 Tax=Paenibacillus lactis TaxID=228574 RepID=G4HA71_9BACL|nr:N-acetyltransferase [Paenibacillus lactis]EHB66830.1 GCN5-related N-acetyltransferase [Paenibacillus lactis 154]MBP1893666.1 putative acetyltransferase [Paenibacillus lactis]MCM3492038.1 N-acetyltransferase [Paenibacillus lactis]GIO92475.1 acetyltransferase [Paenibacillus lactis]
MQIRLMTDNDMDSVIDIWLAASKEAHHFIPQEYWESKEKDMRSVYLPMAETYVLEEAAGIVGFISTVQHALAALFVHPREQGKGYGLALLQSVKERGPKLELKVYKENENAFRFYSRHGFSVVEETVDEDTGHAEYVMSWEER